ncbi:hypothetical protein [Methylophilus sp. Leaf414]|uniref:hypothetical protein n=1 Tax=Methylophilus sp. Leaf414 TaxID=1736371 RepID=UPI0006F32504|nr:hypothetical protein [Methylophilus sp. Leaf414]KQT37701.1 hypothetical protein ASG24_01510 [Methylophilus sp. Leaf414]
MGAAALNWIHDTSLDQHHADAWNHASLATRAKLLKQATRDPYQKHLAWESLPELVRADVIYAIDHQEKADKPKAKHHNIAADDPRLWWNKDKV